MSHVQEIYRGNELRDICASGKRQVVLQGVNLIFFLMTRVFRGIFFSDKSRRSSISSCLKKMHCNRYANLTKKIRLLLAYGNDIWRNLKSTIQLFARMKAT